MSLDTRDIAIIAKLIDELSTEIDLHYEDTDLHGVADSIAVLRQGAELLSKLGGVVPDACLHIQARYEKAVGGVN